MSNSQEITKTRTFPKRAFWAALLVPVLILCLMLYKPITTSMLGEEVRLATIPIDPIDLFYGEYVILNLEITEVSINLLSPELQEQLSEHTRTFSYQPLPVYVSLVAATNSLHSSVEGVYHAASVSLNKPSGVYLQGYLQPYIYNDIARIEYGIDRYYVEQGQGILLEDAARDGQVYVDAKIRNGHWILTGIKVQ